MKTITALQDHPVFGRTLELNFLGSEKICSFDCSYCSLGPTNTKISLLKIENTFPSTREILDIFGSTLADEILAHPARRPIIDTVLISGNGEPTLHPQFLELVKSIFQKISELSTDITGSFNTTASKTPRTRVVCLTNGDRLDQRDVVEALNLLDEAIVKLDVGTEVYFKEINRPLSRASVAKLMNGSRRLTNLSIQTAILPGKQGLAQSHLLDDWIESIAILRPQTVYIHPVQGASEDDAYRVCHFLKKHLEKRADNGTKIKALVESDFAA